MRQPPRILELRETDDVSSAVPGVHFRALPSSSCPFQASLATLELGDVMIQTGRCSPMVGIGLVLPAGRVFVQLPYAGVEGFRLNGRPLQHGQFALYREGGSFERASVQETRHLALAVPADLAERLLYTRSAGMRIRSGGPQLHRADTADWHRVARIAEAAYETIAGDPGAFDGTEPQRAMRDLMIDAARGLIERSDGWEADLRDGRITSKRRRIVAEADDYIHAHVARPIYTEQLCAALGISASALADAFRATFGMKPHRFLKLRRLAMVRAAIRAEAAQGSMALVKTIALSHGFWHLGQFAHDYRALYGETPSDTRMRALDDVGCASLAAE